MKNETRDLLSVLTENNQDFEWYPTTDQMLEEVYSHIGWKGNTEILDIGCGLCGLKKLIDRCNKNRNSDNFRNYDYFVIEKSEILLNRLPSDVYVLGTDFNTCTLIDKNVDVIFCNPPYSEFKEWVKRIICEGNFKQAFLIIPQRWKEDAEIMTLLQATRTNYHVHKTMDFLNAERQARATIDIVELWKNQNSWDKRDDVFDRWFEQTFQVSADKNKIRDYEEEQDHKKRIKSNLIPAQNKIETLCNLYQDDMERLYGSFKALCALDEKTLEDIGVNYKAVKEALKKKISGLKIIYWQTVFDYLDEITDRLTQKSREQLFQKFERLNTVDFNEGNIRSVVIWVIKNATDFYKKQLIEFYKNLSSFENVKPYKSNEKTFSQSKWRYNMCDDDRVKYTLDYRIICSYLFKCSTSWSGKFDSFNVNRNEGVLKDFCAIARNLGFSIGHYENADCWGEKFYIYLTDGTPLIEYKLYQNGNTHVKLNIEFCKAMNVEVARLLGWIHSKQDIEKEFPEKMAKGAEKYFGSQFCFAITNPNIKLLGVTK